MVILKAIYQKTRHTDMIKKYITNFNEKTHFAKSNYDNLAVTATAALSFN